MGAGEEDLVWAGVQTMTGEGLGVAAQMSCGLTRPPLACSRARAAACKSYCQARRWGWLEGSVPSVR